VFNRRADAVFVSVLRKWRGQLVSKHPAAAPLLRAAGISSAVGLLILAGLLAYRPNLLRIGPGPVAGIVGNLVRIDEAKRAWSLGHPEGVTMKLTENDLAPYLAAQSKGPVHAVAEERYVIGRLTESPVAVLTSEVDEYPAGTLIRVGTNADAVISVPGKR